jgi:hypothetical protein
MSILLFNSLRLRQKIAVLAAAKQVSNEDCPDIIHIQRLVPNDSARDIFHLVLLCFWTLPTLFLTVDYSSNPY